MTLEEHARAIEAAIKAAADDGFYLDVGDGCALPALDLNQLHADNTPMAWEGIELPYNPLTE
ncbi:hypothetical protein AB0K92_16075 [Streptomyces sp. NPDC052687]|uniref:hypothetical protein n=1 Tax=Streptomyces sp. NPDC052687 TaxID=3154759 RepID=UPI00341AB6A3